MISFSNLPETNHSKESELNAPAKWPVWLGHGYFLIFLAMAVFFYQERVFMADCAFHIFTILRTGDFAIFQNRYPIAIPQALPVLGVNLGLPLNAILVLYSVSVPLVCYIFYLLVAHVVKDYKGAIAMVLTSCLILTQGFFFTWELNQAVCLLVLLFSFSLTRHRYRLYHWVLLSIGIVVALLYHPLVFMGMLYLWGFEYLRKGAWRDKKLGIMVGITVVFIIIKMLFLTNKYDKQKMSVPSMLRSLPDFFTSETVHNFSRWLVQDYYLLLVFTVIILIFYISRRKWLLAGFYLLAVTGFTVLVLLAHPGANDSIRYYLELHYLILALFAAVPMAYDIVPEVKSRYLVPVLLFILIVSRFITFYSHRTVFTERLQWYDKLYSYTSQFPENRFIIRNKNLPDLIARNQLTWASGYESLLYFASQGKPLKTFLLLDNPNQFDWLPRDGKQFVTAFETFTVADLPAKYFNLMPSDYRKLHTGPEQPGISNLGQVEVKPLEEEIKGKAKGRPIRIPVQIVSPVFLGSALGGENTLELGYHLYRDGAEVAGTKIFTPLEIDIKGTYNQILLVSPPATPGKYILEPVLLLNGISAWNNAGSVILDIR